MSETQGIVVGRFSLACQIFGVLGGDKTPIIHSIILEVDGQTECYDPTADLVICSPATVYFDGSSGPDFTTTIYVVPAPIYFSGTAQLETGIVAVDVGRISIGVKIKDENLSIVQTCSTGRFATTLALKADAPFWLQVLHLVNVERAAESLTPLVYNYRLQTAAIRHAEDMATNEFLSHTGSDSSSTSDRITDAGYFATPIGENVAEGTAAAFDAQWFVDLWMDSAPHRAIILDSSFRATGIFDAIGANGQRYICQVFGFSTGEVALADAGRFNLVSGFSPELAWWTGDLRFHLYVKNINSFGNDVFIIGGNNLGENVLNLIHSGIGIEKQAKLVNDLSGVLRKFLWQQNSISGDPVTVPNKHLHSLAALDDFRLRQKVNLSVADESVTTHIQQPSEIYLDGIVVMSQVQSTQLAYNPNTGRYEINMGSINPDLYALADPETNPGDARIQVHIGGQVVGFTVNSRTGDPATGFTIMGTSDVVALSASRIAVTTAEVYLDGRPLSSRAEGINISCDESNVHNEITISGNDPELFAMANPEILYGEPRIEARVGSRIINFLLLSREGEKTDFMITGLSVSAKEDMPFTAEIDFQLTEPTLASDIAASLTQYCPVEWVAEDWLVPSGFSFSGTPLYGITQLAGEIGAVVRCRDDGSILIRKRRPVRPIHMPFAVADVSYNRSSLIMLGHSEDLETGYNAVKVTGQTPDSSFVPQIQLEPIPEGESTRSPGTGEACYIRVYWAGNDPSVFNTYVTDGIITPVGGGAFFTDIEETIIDFINGIGNVSLPIFELISCAWIGDPGGQPTFVKHSTELSIGTGKFRVGTVKYRTRFQRYKIDMHNVERLIAVLFLGSTPDISVTIRTSDNPVEGDVIDAPLLTSEYAAVARGTDWIDRQYRKSICDITVPYNDSAIDGNIAYIDDDHIGVPGNYHIVSSEISIEGPKILNNLKVEKCMTSFNR